MSGLNYNNTKDVVSEKRRMFDFVFMIKAVAIAYVISVILLVMTALIATFQSVSDKGIGIMVNVVTAIGVMLCGFLTGRRSDKGGLLAGAVSGVVYTLLLCLIGNLVARNFSPGINVITAQIIGVVCGSVGGIIGINTKKNRRR